jgi:hypothetical protein
MIFLVCFDLDFFRPNLVGFFDPGALVVHPREHCWRASDPFVVLLAVAKGQLINKISKLRYEFDLLRVSYLHYDMILYDIKKTLRLPLVS